MYDLQLDAKGSKVITYSNSSNVTSSAPYQVNEEDNIQIQPYLPYTQLRIINNNTSTDFIFYKNQNLSYGTLVKSSSSVILTNEPTVSWSIFAVGAGTLSANDIRIEAQHLPITQDTLIQRRAGNPILKFLGVA